MLPYTEVDYHGDESVSEKGSSIAKIIARTLQVAPVRLISLADAEEEYEANQQKVSADTSEDFPF